MEKLRLGGTKVRELLIAFPISRQQKTMSSQNQPFSAFNTKNRPFSAFSQVNIIKAYSSKKKYENWKLESAIRNTCLEIIVDHVKIHAPTLSNNCHTGSPRGYTSSFSQNLKFG